MPLSQPSSSIKPSSDGASSIPAYDQPESSTQDSSDEEALLPTYEQSTSLEGIIPEVTATPDRVRDFLKHLLITKRSLTVDHADQIASKWTTGTGHELRTYPPTMYLDIFGREDGWTVYKEAQLWMFIYDGKKTWMSLFWKQYKLSHHDTRTLQIRSDANQSQVSVLWFS